MLESEFGKVLPSGRLDQFGATVSAACGVHCLLTPWLLALLPMGAVGVLADEKTEWGLLAVSLLSGLASLVPSYFRHHHDGTALRWFLVGGVLLLGAKTSLEESAVSGLLLALGGVALFGGHRINARLCRDCTICKNSPARRRDRVPSRIADDRRSRETRP
jgi:hypothetical protein